MRRVRVVRVESEWTLESLKAYVDALRADDKEMGAQALAAAKEAVSIVEVANKEWRAASNEWRGALDDRERAAAAALEKFAPREFVDTVVAGLSKEIDGLKEWRSKNEGVSMGSAARGATAFATRGQVIAAIGVTSGLVGVAAAILARL